MSASSNERPRYITISEAGRALDVSRSYVRVLIDGGHIREEPVIGTVRILLTEDVDRLAAERAKGQLLQTVEAPG